MMEINGAERLRFGAYEADLHTHELWKHGTRVKLVGQPFEILAVLLKRPGQLVTRDELREQLWPGDTFVDFNHGLNAAVNKLRDALCDSAEDPKYIETLPRRGYRLITTVERSKPVEAPASSVTGATRPAVEAAASQEPVGPPAMSSGKVLVGSPAVGEPGERDRPVEKRRWGTIVLAAFVVMVALRFLPDIARMVHSYARSWQDKQAAELVAPGALTPLTGLSDRTGTPAFSPDGTRVAFRRESFVPGNSGIWIKQIGGEQLVQLTNDSGDTGPVWAPDGKSVAFSRLSERQRVIYQVSAVGGELRELSATTVVPGHAEIDWSPDGKTIAFAARGKQGLPAIFALSLAEHSRRQVTSPVGVDEDWGPAFSPDGNQIAFVRTTSVMIMPAEGGELRRVTSEPVRVMGSPAWAPDGQSIVFASAGQDRVGLWRISVNGGRPAPIREAGQMALNPAISRRGYRLALELFSSARSINQLDLEPAGQRPRTLVTAVTGENSGQQLSPDGKRLVFQSDRTGGLDIWVSDRNGQNAIQLTAIGTTGAPRWSPNGKEIAFDVGLGRDWREPRAVFVVDADGGTPHALVQDSFSNPVPNWSRDGKWIYFASNRSGDWQVWKEQRAGGAPVQVTKQGGFAAAESPDGKYLYYSKHNNDSPDIWRVPIAGGEEMPVYPGIRPLDWAAWTVLPNGILFVAMEGAEGIAVPTVDSYDFSTQGVKHLGVIDKAPFWVTGTADGKSVIFDQPGQEESHVMLLENFR